MRVVFVATLLFPMTGLGFSRSLSYPRVSQQWVCLRKTVRSLCFWRNLWAEASRLPCYLYSDKRSWMRGKSSSGLLRTSKLTQEEAWWVGLETYSSIHLTTDLCLLIIQIERFSSSLEKKSAQATCAEFYKYLALCERNLGGVMASDCPLKIYYNLDRLCTSMRLMRFTLFRWGSLEEIVHLGFVCTCGFLSQ